MTYREPKAFAVDNALSNVGTYKGEVLVIGTYAGAVVAVVDIVLFLKFEGVIKFKRPTISIF